MISFIIPVYNKGSVLFKTLTSLINHLTKASIQDFEIIVVNDGSTDNSFEEAVRFKKFNGDTRKIKIFHYTKNIGKGFALRFGFYKSLGDPIVFLDGDMDINTRQIVTAIKTHHEEQVDMIVGSKYHPKSRIYYPLNRYIYSLVLRFIIRILFHLNITDTQVGLKIFSRQVLSQVIPRLVIKRFAVDLEILVVARQLGFTKFSEIPVIIKHTSANSSTIDLVAVKNFCLDIAAIFYRKNILRYYEQSDLPKFSPTLTVQAA